MSLWKSSARVVEIIDILQEPKVDRQREILKNKLVDFLLPIPSQQIDLLSQNESIVIHQRPSLRTIFLGFKISWRTHKSILWNPFESIEACRFVKSSWRLEKLLFKIYIHKSIFSEQIFPANSPWGS